MIKKDYSTDLSAYAIKFIVNKLKALMSDEFGERKHKDEFDDVFMDIFEQKKFGTRLFQCYDDREVYRCIINFGFPILMVATNTPRIYQAIDDLIKMRVRMDYIKERVKKDQKHGKKKDKSLVHEFEYLQELYKDASKALRKKLKITKKSDYKNRYRAASDIANKGHGGYGSFWDDDDDDESVFSNSLSSDIDQDYDIDPESEFAMMLKKSGAIDSIIKNGKKSANKQKISRRRKSELDDDDDDEDFDDDDDDEDEDEDEREPDKMFKADYDEKLDRITQNINDLTTVTQMLVNARFDQNQSEAFIANKLSERIASKSQAMQAQQIEARQVSPNSDIVKDIQDIKNVVGALVKSQKSVIDNMSDVSNTLAILLDDDTDTEEPVGINVGKGLNIEEDDAPPEAEAVSIPDATYNVASDNGGLDPNASRKEAIEYCNAKPINMEAPHKPVKVIKPDQEADEEQPSVLDPNTGLLRKSKEPSESST